MKPYTYAFLAAAAACGLASAAETAYTTPVGYVSLGNTTPSQPAVAANSDAFITIPLQKSASFTGTVSSVAGDVITLSGTPGFTAGQFTSSPFVARLGSGAKEGLVALVTANSADSITLSVQPGDSLAGVVAGDSVSIQASWTVASLFAGNTIPSGTQLLAYSGTGAGILVAPDLIFEFDGSNWVDTNSFDTADGFVLYPGEGFVLRTVGTEISSLVVTGEVPTSKHRLVVPNLSPGVGQDSTVGFFSPVGELIGSSGLGWTAGDQLLVWDNTTSGIIKAPVTVLEFDGTAWVDTNTFDDVSATFSLNAGQSYVFRRSATAPGGDVIWSDSQSYLPSL